MSCDNPGCLYCPVKAVVEHLMARGLTEEQVLELALGIVGKTMGVTTSVIHVPPGGTNESTH